GVRQETTQREGPMSSFYADMGQRRGLAAWMLSTDHKRIGLMYLAAVLVFFTTGSLVGVLMRLSLIAPGTFMGAHTYNRLFTVHGIIQIFLFIIPGIPVSFGNFFLPLLIGARDVAFPRINRLSWWLYLAGAGLMLSSLFFGGGALDTGWTLYATGWVQILATPVIAISLLLIILERFFGLGFFDPSKGGDPVLFEHMFWIYSHPAVYIM